MPTWTLYECKDFVHYLGKNDWNTFAKLNSKIMQLDESYIREVELEEASNSEDISATSRTAQPDPESMNAQNSVRTISSLGAGNVYDNAGMQAEGLGPERNDLMNGLINAIVHRYQVVGGRIRLLLHPNVSCQSLRDELDHAVTAFVRVFDSVMPNFDIHRESVPSILYSMRPLCASNPVCSIALLICFYTLRILKVKLAILHLALEMLIMLKIMKILK